MRTSVLSISCRSHKLSLVTVAYCFYYSIYLSFIQHMKWKVKSEYFYLHIFVSLTFWSGSNSLQTGAHHGNPRSDILHMMIDHRTLHDRAVHFLSHPSFARDITSYFTFGHLLTRSIFCVYRAVLPMILGDIFIIACRDVWWLRVIALMRFGIFWCGWDHLDFLVDALVRFGLVRCARGLIVRRCDWLIRLSVLQLIGCFGTVAFFSVYSILTVVNAGWA